MALLVVYAAILVGRRLEPWVTSLGRQVKLDETVRETPFAAVFPDGPDGVSRTCGVLVKYYVAAVAVIAVVEWLAFRTGATTSWFFSNWAQDLFGYVPPLVLGILALFVGFSVANWATEQVRESTVAAQLGASALLAGITKALLYFVVLVIGLQTMGIDVAILHTFAQAFAFSVGLAVALAAGIAFGWGGKDYVAENIDDWVDQSRAVTSESATVTGDD